MPDDLVEDYVRDDFGCDWGRAVAVNDAGIVLVVRYVGMQLRAISWNPMAGTTEVIGGMTGICPSAITVDGVVLGTARWLTRSWRGIALKKINARKIAAFFPRVNQIMPR